MRLSVPLLTLAGTVAGTAAAVVAYQATAAAPVTKPASATTGSPAPVSTTSWLPCERGWKVNGTACVRIEEKVVVVPDLPAEAAAAAQTAGVRSTSTGHAGSDDATESEHATEGENEAADQAGEDTGQSAEDESGHEDVGGDD